MTDSEGLDLWWRVQLALHRDIGRFKTAVTSIGLTVEATFVLFAVIDQPLTPSMIARRLGLAPSQVARATSRLTQHDLISITKHSADRRLRLVRVTAAGHVTAAQLRRHLPLSQRLERLSPEERATMSQLLRAGTDDDDWLSVARSMLALGGN